MADVQAGAGWIREHVENVGFRDLLRFEVFVPLCEWMLGIDFLAGIPGAKCLLRLPMLLPFGFDQMKRILSASCHKPGNIAKMKGTNNSLLKRTKTKRRKWGGYAFDRMAHLR